MIILTRCNGTTIMLNENFIEMAEETPDTVVTMQNGHRYIVQEKLEDIIAMAAAYRRQNVTDKEN
ncbi:MAG: flagellar FlbD family protein [Oscillospiraceae bacterium]|nr:flagellar FlbD family protein [Oscillospiraceae bacterium]